MKWLVVVIGLGLVACNPKHPMVESVPPLPPPVVWVPTPARPATPAPTATPEPMPTALVGLPPTPRLSAPGEKLIIEQEVDHPYRASYPEAPDCRYSGITEGVGYDNHANAAAIVLSDWAALPASGAPRLAATHPYYGCAAQTHLKDVRDILISWSIALDIFTRVDVARTWADCRRAFPGFDELRPNAQAALVSLVFNRGASFVGPNRLEMRNIRDLVLKQDYAGMAEQFRKMVRLWIGTSIENGMRRRRNAEANLLETP